MVEIPTGVQDLLLNDAEVWFRSSARIRTKDGPVIKAPTPNILQERVFAYYRYCQARRIPCLIQILKPRQKGASTIAEAVIYQHMRKNPDLRGSLMGDIQATSDKVFEMFRLYGEKDDFTWSAGGKNIAPGKNAGDEIELINGSIWYKETAGSKNAGRSGTIQVAHMDEVAFFPVSEKRDPTLGYLNSFYSEGENSLGFATSTPNGATGWFYKNWISRNSWKKIFAAWFEFDDSVKAFENAEEREYFMAHLRKDEQEEIALYPQITAEHLNWRRMTIEDKCEGDINRFKQEFASDDKTCFMLSSRPKFCQIRVTEAMKEAMAGPRPEVGTLMIQGKDESVIWIPDDAGDFKRVEEPRYGCRYLVSVDTCSGEDQQVGGKTADPDYHDIVVWRQMYYDVKFGMEMLPKVVMHHKSRMDTDLLVDLIVAASIYYGRCFVVPEVNGEGGLHTVKLLQKRQVSLYKRKVDPQSRGKRETEQEKLDRFGWRTTPASRKLIIDSMVGPWRDGKVDLSFPEIIEQYQNFVVDEKGKARAMDGMHDDSVISTCLGHYCLPSATEYKYPERRVDLWKLKNDPNYLLQKGWKRV